MTELTYAIVGGPPHDWCGLLIRDLETNALVQRVVEVNTAEGWLIRYKTDDKGQIYVDPAQPDEAARERIEGRFRIERPA